MASYTPNYNLKKPADSDYYDIADDNGNMDKIDTALNTLNSKINKLRDVETASDLNTLGETRIAYTNANTANSPGQWYVISSYYGSSSTEAQFGMGVTDGKFVYRAKNSTGGWSDWKEVALKSDIKSQLTPATGVNIQKATRVGDQITIQGATAKIATANTDQQVLTIPSGLRPSSIVVGSFGWASASDAGTGTFFVNANGNAIINYSKATTYGLYFTVTYTL